MVNRAALGLEVPSEKVFIAQKWMIEKANVAAKPVIAAAQMFDSMCTSKCPTRAEASDVTNAVLDGADCVMLCAETSNGQNPLTALSEIAKICCEAEKTIDHKSLYEDLRAFSSSPVPTAEAVACAAVGTVNELQVNLVIVLTESGKLGRLVAKYRPSVPILACSTTKSVVCQLNTTRGIVGFKMPSFQSADSLLKLVIQTARDSGLCQAGDKVVTIQSSKEDTLDE